MRRIPRSGIRRVRVQYGVGSQGGRETVLDEVVAAGAEREWGSAREESDKGNNGGVSGRDMGRLVLSSCLISLGLRTVRLMGTAVQLIVM